MKYFSNGAMTELQQVDTRLGGTTTYWYNGIPGWRVQRITGVAGKAIYKLVNRFNALLLR